MIESGEAPVRPRAVLFDIDGTLVDSNYLHIEAWDYAFTAVNLPVPSWRLHRLMGADARTLIGDLVHSAAPEVMERLQHLHRSRYSKLATRLHVFPGARELVRAIDTHHTRVVLATSASKEEIKSLLPLLDLNEVLYAITSGDDVKKAKPDPAVIVTALEKAGVAAEDAIMVGDSIWDVRAARAAGIDTVGVCSGGISAAELKEAGAVAVYEDIQALLDQVDRSPLARLWGAHRPLLTV